MATKKNNSGITKSELLLDMVKNHAGSVSSKIIIGSITYLVLTVAIIVVMFLNSSFPGLSEIIITLILASGSLLGLTTVENIKQKKIQEEDTEE